jgi:hypothetical protein
MKTILISLAALAAVSTAALAERNYDISSPPYGETVVMKKMSDDVNAFTAKVIVTDGDRNDGSNDSAGSR